MFELFQGNFLLGQVICPEKLPAERDYVFDLEAVREIYIQGLRSASPPIIRETFLNKFIAEVFGNLDQVVAHHQHMLGALFSRQREQHPLVQSVSDIILDSIYSSISIDTLLTAV
jgi:hypothetical protein